MSINSQASERLSVRKTYKNFVGGQFPRSESGRTYEYISPSADVRINVSLSSRKDVRDAVTTAKAAGEKWAHATAYNRGQILYRIAEVMEARHSQFVEELQWQGQSLNEARYETQTAIDRVLHYAGWSDKYQQIFGSVNPVASSHFNFTCFEPTGVVGVLAPQKNPLVGLVSFMAPILVGGNSSVILASEDCPLSAVSLSEVLSTSDVPAGVVNILTGKRAELLPTYSTHMEISCVAVGDASSEELKALETEAAFSVKRVRSLSADNWCDAQWQGPSWILDYQESKTTWHPIGL
jgi:acyl-CoA reductase-like NAD-dependent aldehyde dehydrogenase